MKIKNRLYLSVGIVIVLVTILLFIVSATSNRVAEGNKKRELLDTVRVNVSELDIVTYDYLLHREKRMEQQWKLKYDTDQKKILEYKSIFNSIYNGLKDFSINDQITSVDIANYNSIIEMLKSVLGVK